MSDLSGWTEDSDGEVRQRLETRLMEIIGIEDDNERNQYIEHKIRCVRPHSQTGKRCGAKVVEVVRLDNLPLPTDLTIRAIRFRRALQDSLGVDRADFQNARDHALAFLEAKDDRPKALVPFPRMGLDLQDRRAGKFARNRIAHDSVQVQRG